MCNTISTLKSSAIFWIFPLVPNAIASYTGFSLTCASLGIYILRRQRPSEKLSRLEDAIELTEEILKRAKTSGERQFSVLLGLESRLLQYAQPTPSFDERNNIFRTKLAASKIQTRILRADEDETWNEYLHTLRGILQSIDDCARKVDKIRTETLVSTWINMNITNPSYQKLFKLAMEDERQRQISENIRESHEVEATAFLPIRALFFTSWAAILDDQ
ncbi:hypothetical protein B0H11DRAFT_2068761 [Mycena galericulata]|nr:hypothetical protein B0H11DRAFT_2068761 [Mycena galericulata]